MLLSQYVSTDGQSGPDLSPALTQRCRSKSRGGRCAKCAVRRSRRRINEFKAFEGKPTLINLWASWCAPCIKELPTLDQLARTNGGRFNVVAISQDMAPHASVEAFLKAHQITTLKGYQDPKMALSGALDAEVLPTSILFDATGKEVWRYVGDQDWTSPAAAKLLAEAKTGSY